MVPGPSPPRERQEGGWGGAQDGKSGDQRRAGPEGADEAGVGPWQPLQAGELLKRNVDSLNVIPPWAAVTNVWSSGCEDKVLWRTYCMWGWDVAQSAKWMSAIPGD